MCTFNQSRCILGPGLGIGNGLWLAFQGTHTLGAVLFGATFGISAMVGWLVDDHEAAFGFIVASFVQPWSFESGRSKFLFWQAWSRRIITIICSSFK